MSTNYQNIRVPNHIASQLQDIAKKEYERIGRTAKPLTTLPSGELISSNAVFRNGTLPAWTAIAKMLDQRNRHHARSRRQSQRKPKQ